ncbi:HD domain-containing protein [Streptomyces sp. NBC_01808]|uniref:HD domain-containing protein n=1 Tax=Streptomyces sp. NBC_01808 TaxID=2975947 RepID=UPI002DDC548A|nr:HD domain-containing protein [Streptomyces sp. NBC_01808]WSA36789.1 HD domain-containing protein [Streptomyces sp. NBC_01808]
MNGRPPDAARIGERLSSPARTVWAKSDQREGGRSGAWLPLWRHMADSGAVAGRLWDDWLPRQVRRSPHFLPFLGRRACPPGRRLDLGVRHDTGLETALLEHPWLASAWYREQTARTAPDRLPVRLDSAPDDPPGDVVADQPLSFDPRHRRYARRSVRHDAVPRPAEVPEVPEHDPMPLLESD